MAEPTLEQIFGANASQDATTLTIAKSDLTSVGLTASASNTPESLFVAVLLKSAAYLNEANQQTNPDIQITIAESFQSLVSRNNQQYRQRSYSVNLDKPDTAGGIDPDDY